MEQEKKSNWFGFTDKQEADRAGGDFFPSFSGKGYEEISMTREDIFHDFERGSHPGQDRLLLKELPKFLLDKFRSSSETGTLNPTFAHYVGELKKSGLVDDKVIRALEAHVSVVNKATTIKEQQEVYQGIAEYLGKIRMEKI